MDLDLSADQQLLLATTRQFLRDQWPAAAVRERAAQPDIDRSLWRSGAELGWTSMLIPEERGGGSVSGDGLRDLGILAEELGRHLVTAPVLAANVAASALAACDSPQLQEDHLPRIAAGAEIAVWAAGRTPGGFAAAGELQVTGVPAGYRLDGTVGLAEGAQAADILLVTAGAGPEEIQFLLPLDTPAVSVEPLESLDITRRFCQVRFRGAELPPAAVIRPRDAAGGYGRQLALAVALQCAETVGATDQLYTMTLAYIKDRTSFGRPVGSYQAVKHRMADMLLWLESAKAAAAAAVSAVQDDAGASTAVSVAKAYIADRCPVIVRECLQLHGGIGYTWDYDLHLYLRRVEANAILYGDADWHRDRLASAIGV